LRYSETFCILFAHLNFKPMKNLFSLLCLCLVLTISASPPVAPRDVSDDVGIVMTADSFGFDQVTIFQVYTLDQSVEVDTFSTPVVPFFGALETLVGEVSWGYAVASYFGDSLPPEDEKSHLFCHLSKLQPTENAYWRGNWLMRA